jgi:glycosyltransferase involved in cell wall biosynthesis
MKKTKVLFFSPALAPYRLDLYNDLSSRVDLHLCFMNRLLAGITDGHYLAGELKANHSFLDRSFTFFGRKFHLGISQALARENPDIVVTPEFSPVTVALVLMKIFRRKVLHVVITDDNTASLHSDSLMRRVLRKIALSRIDALICVSREAAHIYEFRYGFGGAIAVVPILQAESIYAVKMKCATEKGKEIVERHGLVGKRVLLYVGRLAPEKALV